MGRNKLLGIVAIVAIVSIFFRQKSNTTETDTMD